MNLIRFMATYMMPNVKAYMSMKACNIWIITAGILGLCVICPKPIQTFLIGLGALCLLYSEMVNSWKSYVVLQTLFKIVF